MCAMEQIYNCYGIHFKAYNSKNLKVLEHPNIGNVEVIFQLDDEIFQIDIIHFIEKQMRIAGQKDRIDLYILQRDFQPLLNILYNQLNKRNIAHSAEKQWRYGNPEARIDRQGVPQLIKLAEIHGINAKIPYTFGTIECLNSSLIIDSEIPGKDQTKWVSEGGSRQIHFGIFNGILSQKSTISKTVKIQIPTVELQNNFIKPILEKWVT